MPSCENMDNTSTIQQMIEAHAEQSPNHIAMIDDNFIYHYRTLNQKANRLAHYLLDFKPQQDNLIAIAIDPSPQLIIGILAILKAGCGYLPLDARHPKDRLQFILEDTQAPILITQTKSKERFSGYAGQIILIDEIWSELDFKSIFNPTCVTSPENLAYTIYTSGSTGQPKGVLIQHKSVINYINWFGHYSACHTQDRVDFSSNIIFDMAVTTTITALALGLQIVICPEKVKKNAIEYLLFLKKNRINITKLTPSYFKVLIQEAQHHRVALPDLQSIILGGEILLSKDCKAWLAIYPNHHLYNEYGPTEATVAVTQYKVTLENISQLEAIVPIGAPAFNTECFIVNEHMQTIVSGETGELYVSGICLARGYLNQTELTEKKFITQSPSRIKLYKTGDLCRFLQNGEIEFLKRIDDQVKIRGFRVEPGEIESWLTLHPLIKESAVLTQNDARGEAQLIAYYISEHEDNIPDSHELRLYLQKKMADYMLPTAFIRMKEFPLTENGKLDKKAFPKPVLNNNLVTPGTEIEHQLIDIWKKEFHLQDIGITSNFFELGGHSLIAIRIASEIEKTLDKKISIEDIFKTPTIAQLAKTISTAACSPHEIETVLSSKNNMTHFPLGDFQFTFWVSNLFEPKIKNLNIISRRRVNGKLDVQVLNRALEWVFKKHEILTCRPGKHFPVMHINKNAHYEVIQENLTRHTNNQSEVELSDSLNEILDHARRQKNTPLVTVKLYLLENGSSELQISAAHIGFDDASEEIFFSDLSTAYLHLKNNIELPPISEHAQYKDYVFYERNHLNQNLETDIPYWQEYLGDTELVVLPENEVLKNMANIPYSTYLDLPIQFSSHIHQICTSASVSMADLLCAAITLALKNAAERDNNNIFINIIRSMRNNAIHDSMIGCFLRLDPIKVSLKTNLNLVDLAKSIQQSRIAMEPYQACSGMVKLACLNKRYRKNIVMNTVIGLFAKIYCKLFPWLQLNPKMLVMYERLKSLRTKRQFLVNVNLLNSAITAKDDNSLFGYELSKVKNNEYDLSKIDNVLDICIFRNESYHKNYLVISGNLNPLFRQHLGKEIISLLGCHE